MSIRAETFIQNFSAIILATTNQILIEIVVPAKAVMTVKGFGNYAGAWTAWGTVFWEFSVDEYPLFPYQRIMDQIGFGTNRQNVQAVEITGGHVFRVRAYNPDLLINYAMGISLEYDLAYPEQGV
jgi:hypothetical protein